MVDLTKMRWRIERDYLELKQEVGLGHGRQEAPIVDSLNSPPHSA